MPYFDVDWGHKHDNCPHGAPHIHFWKKNKKGEYERQSPRALEQRELKIFKKLLDKIKKGA